MTTTEPSESFQIPIEAAEAYEAAFVPAFFAQWAPILCDAAGVTAGRRVLDVACGTGIVARTAADRVGAANVVGIDLNDAMLTVARRLRPDIDWRQGDAAALPLDNASFDIVVCQMALMFLPDGAAALREMARVAAPGGTVAVLVPSSLDAQPAYGPFVDMAAQHAGAEARSLLSTYFALGQLPHLTELFEKAGLPVASTSTHLGTARFPSVDALVTAEVDSTPLGERISTEVHDQIRQGARKVLAPFTTPHGSLEAPFEVHVVAARRP
ncbi:MAG TPA: methyltransferase domain-containing protein [Egibacteraceae bacterium]|nr:methyltransferase domain-containing protein [Egibacteraceae bacterium]